MSPPSEGPPAVSGGLLERLQFISDVEEACHLVLERVLHGGGAERAAIVLTSEEGLFVVGYGVPDDQLDALTRGMPAQKIRDALEHGEDCTIEGSDVPDPLDLAELRVIPFPGPRGRPAGAILLHSGDSPGPTAAIVDDVRRGGPTLARIHGQNVAERKAQRVEKENDLLSTVVDALSDPVVLTDHQNNFVFANRRAEELFHAGASESEGRRRAIRVNDLLFSSFLTQTVIGGGEPTSRELNLVDPSDGTDLLFEFLSIRVPHQLGERGAVLSVLRDITDLKRAVSELEVQFNRSRVAEQQARRESERLEVILSNVGDPILVTDEDSKIILMNAEAERLFEADAAEMDEEEEETPAEELAAQPARRAIRANDTRFTTLISDFLLQQEDRRIEKLILTDPETSESLPVEVVSSKIPGRRGEVSAIVSILHDLTQVVENERLARELRILNEGLEERIKLATEELEERNRRLEWQSRELQKASRLKSEFLASMSHELRTPINAMLGYTALMREEIYGELNEKQESALRKIYSASQHLLALINDILDLSKIEAGRMPVRIEDVNLDAVVTELSQTIEPLLREKDLEYETQIAEDLPVLHTDRTKVKQILLNLLSNAVKFTPDGSVHLTARAGTGDGTVIIEVQDTGIGMDDESLKTIFDDFRQVDQSPTRRFGGTGLGLSITRKLVALMGGSIEVESEVDEGSLFRVELPVELEVDEASEEPDGRGSVPLDDDADPPE